MNDKQPNLAFLLDEILSGDATRIEQARVMLLAMDENAIPPLVDAFYAGVSEAQGVVLLDVVAEIGGPEAIALLEDVFQSPDKPAWERWAALGLARNFREDIADTLFDWLQGDNTAQRQTAALALGYVGDEGAEMALVHALHDPEINLQAVRALQRRQSVIGLLEGFATDNAELWLAITDALLDIQDEGRQSLLDIVQNEHPAYYDSVMVSLQNLSRPEAAAILNATDIDHS